MTLNHCFYRLSSLLRSAPSKLAVMLMMALAAAMARGTTESPAGLLGDSHQPLPEQLPYSFFTFEPQEYWREPEDSYWLSFSNWVIRQEKTQGRRVQALGEWADRTFSGSRQALPDNESYLRVGFATESEYGNPAQFDPEAKFRLDIPTVQRKLRLVVESESDELIPLSERRRNRQLTETARSDTEPTGALRFLSQVGDAVNLSNDLGVRLRIPADAFWRATAEKQWQPGAHWGFSVKQRIYYFHQDGWGARSSFAASRDLGNGWQGVLSSELVWLHSERRFEFSQTLNGYKRLNNRATLNPRIGFFGDSQPNWRHNSVFADLTWRYRIYGDWLFGEVIPAVEFPREKSFSDQASLILRIELFFSGSINRPY